MISYIPCIVEGLWNYKAELAGDFSFRTENKNHGDDYTRNLSCKRFYFAQPQLCYKLNNVFSLGTKVNMYYHFLRSNNNFKAYLPIAVKCKP